MGFKGKCAAMGVLCLVGIAAMGVVVMGLWNWILPGLFNGVHPINYVHALGLMVLCRILFGGFRGRGGRKGGWGRQEWRQWAQMTPEERAQFKAERASACGSWRRTRGTVSSGTNSTASDN